MTFTNKTNFISGSNNILGSRRVAGNSNAIAGSSNTIMGNQNSLVGASNNKIGDSNFASFYQTHHSNSTSNMTKNSTKILFCKTKALFFQKVYHALKKDRTDPKESKVAIVQTTGTNLKKFMDNDCFVDSQIEDSQLYNVQFTVAIMELSPAQ